MSGLTILTVVVVVMFAIVISILIWAAVSKSSSGNDTTKPPCSQIVDVDSLIRIPEDLPRCKQNGRETPFYCISQLGTQEYDYLTAPYGATPIQVCDSFCNKGYKGGKCSGDSVGGKTAQENFDECITQLTDDNCIPPTPIAVRSNILYYANKPSCASCESV